MYYGNENRAGFEQAQTQAGMGIFPIAAVLGAGAALLPMIGGLFKKKDKKPKGPTPAQIEAQRVAQEEELARQQQARNTKYLMIGGGLLVFGLGGYLLLRKKNKQKKRRGRK